MHAKLHTIANRLSTRIIFAFVAVILATTMAAGAPAYWFIRAQMEREAWAHVADGEQVTQALLDAEMDHMNGLAVLASQRPTLQRLLLEVDTVALKEYLETYQTGVDLDFLIVRDASGELLALGDSSFSLSELPYLPGALYFAFPGTPRTLALLASQPIRESPSETLLGYVTVGVILDEQFMHQLAISSGFEQSISIDGERIASTFGETSLISDSEVADSGVSQAHVLAVGESRYYAMMTPLTDDEGQVIAFVEIALPVDSLVASEHSALLTLIGSTLLIAAIGSVFGGLFARRLTAPLSQLTSAAHHISAGDFVTPVPVFEQPVEIATLAAAFEGSRVNTLRALENLARAKSWSETLIQSILEGIITFDSNGRITSFSQGAERMLSLRGEEAVGEHVDEILRLADAEGCFTSRLPECGSKQQISVIAPGGQLMTLAVTVACLETEGNGTAETVLVLRDITEEEAVQHLRSYFLANITHEFRTPLSAINASVELLLDEIDHLSLAEIAELLSSIYLSVSGLQTLIDNLLESMSIEAGHFRIRRRAAVFGEIITETTRIMTPLLDRRHQKLELNLPEKLPVLNVDPTRITQVLVNLLSNASKYGPMDDTIELGAQVDNGHTLRVMVSDRGPGVPSGERAAVFRHFQRRSVHSESEHGVGLGLSVVKTIVEEHGGEVGVDGREGGGSVFWFTIPLNGEDS